jgi:exportin-1
MADKILTEFRQHPDSWTFCDYILTNSTQIFTKVIALGILEDVIKTRWNLLSPDQKMGMRNYLVELLISNVTNDNIYGQPNVSHFISKLNLIIVQVNLHSLYYFR